MIDLLDLHKHFILSYLVVCSHIDIQKREPLLLVHSGLDSYLSPIYTESPRINVSVSLYFGKIEIQIVER